LAILRCWSRFIAFALQLSSRGVYLIMLCESCGENPMRLCSCLGNFDKDSFGTALPDSAGFALTQLMLVYPAFFFALSLVVAAKPTLLNRPQTRHIVAPIAAHTSGDCNSLHLFADHRHFLPDFTTRCLLSAFAATEGTLRVSRHNELTSRRYQPRSRRRCKAC
jgi:hypothetical protein